ncbi:unnamed protein product [Effrenium voratum]|nr:unnamed protein product [Effrenium voratum]
MSVLAAPWLAGGTGVLSLILSEAEDGIHSVLSHGAESQTTSDSCKFKEASNQIARADAPHSAVAKLRRDMAFNILTPMQSHMANNRQLKTNLEIRQRRLVELQAAKRSFEEAKKNHSERDPRHIEARMNFENAKRIFIQIDRHVFEWLYILQEYRGDILDSTLQTLKYLEYEFFASAAHSISAVLPARMEFRPMVEMTPEHLEAQVEMELKQPEDSPDSEPLDFSLRLIEKKVKEDPEDSSPALPVDPLSLSSLLSQGFEEGPARRALRLHRNNTQEALDWLINGEGEVEKQKQVMEGVRMPTTLKRIARLKAMRKSQREQQDTQVRQLTSPPGPSPKPKAKPQDLLSLEASDYRPQPAPDLLSLEEPAVPTDFSKPVDWTSLPDQLSFDSMCSHRLDAAGIADPQGVAAPGSTDAQASSGYASEKPANPGTMTDKDLGILLGDVLG